MDRWLVQDPRVANQQAGCKLRGGPMQKSSPSETVMISWTSQTPSQESELPHTWRESQSVVGGG